MITNAQKRRKPEGVRVALKGSQFAPKDKKQFS